jgi:hypothetical protein
VTPWAAFAAHGPPVGGLEPSRQFCQRSAPRHSPNGGPCTLNTDVLGSGYLQGNRFDHFVSCHRVCFRVELVG